MYDSSLKTELCGGMEADENPVLKIEKNSIAAIVLMVLLFKGLPDVYLRLPARSRKAQKAGKQGFWFQLIYIYDGEEVKKLPEKMLIK